MRITPDELLALARGCEQELLTLDEIVKTELTPLEERERLCRLRGPDGMRLGDARHLRRQILHGLHRAEGTDKRLDALSRDERFAPLRRHLPLFGLLPVRALIARTEAEKAEAEKPKPVESWPQRFRLKTEYQVHDIRAKGGRTVKAKRPITIGDRDVFPGEEVDLNKGQASMYEHLVEPV
jgi:hypothetical protein